MMSTRLAVDRQRLEDDLIVVEAMAKELEEYIVAGNVYCTLSVATPNGYHMLTMSGGDLLTRIKHLQAQRDLLSTEQQSRLTSAVNQVQNTMNVLRTHFYDLLRHELKARRNQLQWNVAQRYAHEYEKADPAELHNREHIQTIEETLNQAA